jgi:hypothetical protein
MNCQALKDFRSGEPRSLKQKLFSNFSDHQIYPRRKEITWSDFTICNIVQQKRAHLILQWLWSQILISIWNFGGPILFSGNWGPAESTDENRKCWCRVKYLVLFYSVSEKFIRKASVHKTQVQCLLCHSLVCFARKLLSGSKPQYVHLSSGDKTCLKGWLQSLQIPWQ